MSNKIIKSETVEKKLAGKSKPTVPPLPIEGGLIRRDELSAQTKAQSIIAQAEADAEKIRKEAYEWRGAIGKEREEAKRKGYEEGKEAGKATLTEEILKVKAAQEKFLQDAEPQLLRLVLTIAEKAIGELAAKHQEVIAAIVRQALEKTLGDRIVVRLHPSDWKRLQSEEGAFHNLLDRTRQLRFREDENIAPGGCVVETEIGKIDAELTTQLKAIRKALGI